jgi:hypothetical protein
VATAALRDDRELPRPLRRHQDMTTFTSARAVLIAVLVLPLGLAACAADDAPAASPTSGPGATPTSTPAAPTPTVIPTPAPTATPAAKTLSLTELKYRVLDAFPDFFWCDPDFYPVARRDEQELANERFPDIQADSAQFQVILTRLALLGSNFTPEQKLAVYREYKRLAAVLLEPSGSEYLFAVRVSSDRNSGETVKGAISTSGQVTVTSRELGFITCPICLTEGTLIDTPTGPVPIEQLTAGMPVWTLSLEGTRVEATVMRTGSSPAGAGQLAVRVTLDDGRMLLVSPRHPDAQGRAVGSLVPGDVLDGAAVTSARFFPYTGAATHDILPSGPTGLYWADGVLLGSTLAP